MKRKNFRFIMTASLSVMASFLGAGTAGAYLSPSNPAVLTVDPAQIEHMDPSYLADFTATADSTYVIGPGSIPDYLTSPNWAYSPPLRKFVDTLPLLGTADSNNLGQYIPVAVPDVTSYPGSDYYEIELRQHTEKMHSDLPVTTLREYMQVNRGTDTSGCTVPDPANPLGTDCVGAAEGAAGAGLTGGDNTVLVQTEPHYLGPIIIAEKDRPVRVKFINKLPTGAGGNLFVPVDTSIMGAGPYEIDYDPVTLEPKALTAGDFTQNRGLLHLHGGRTPWISDGTPHQWITPAGEVTDYPTGVSVENVPDMPDPGPGAQTYYWTNQQSSRMMFYHDHAWGITRLNVYVGEAAGYLIREQAERDLIAAGTIPAAEIPLVIQDKTFVDASEIAKTDPTWAWGTNPWDGTPGKAMTPVEGDLWWPHVYMPAQNPFDFSGIAPMGRWAYGPYFWPATNNFFQPIPNPYYDPACDPALPDTPGSFGGFCQAPEIPSSPNPSWGAEAFMDTPTVNGTAYPVLNVDAQAYRFRILNAAHDRFFNLQMYIADDNPPVPVNTPEFPPNVLDPAFSGAGYTGTLANALATGTEVRMVPATGEAVSIAPPGGTILSRPATWPADGRDGGVPDWSWVGPEWVMIGSEGGFLPKPVVIPNNPVDWNVDVTTFNAGNVNTGSLILGPAERADVIVDFSAYAGKTLILYNDAPAPWPALDPHYDYYTDAPDNRAMGGFDTTPVGFGPNTRTIMQIKVSNTAGPGLNMANLVEAFDPADGTSPGVFRNVHDPIIAGQGDMNSSGDPALYEAFAFEGTGFSAYNDNWNTTFPTSYPNWGIARINDKNISFFNPQLGAVQTVTMKAKAIQDEQGETFDEFGRMRAGLGLTQENPGAGQVNFILQSYSDPSSEVLNEDEVQVWKITHNGVDTHPVHFHLFDVQVLNRVGWDGFLRLPDPTEIGWKDTVRISPLEDTIVALKPVTPSMKFGVPESYRPLNPARPIGDTTALSPIDPVTGQAWATPNLNRFMNLDWEYVWHCHILSHEENDMMRPISLQFAELLPGTVLDVAATPSGADNVLTWTDPTPEADPGTLGNHANEVAFRIDRSVNGGAFTFLGFTLANATTYTDTAAPAGSRYHVFAVNAAGSSVLPMGDIVRGLFNNGTWTLDSNGNDVLDAGVDTTFTFGLATDKPIFGDWDGDGTVEVGVFRNGTWYLDTNGNNVLEPGIDVSFRYGIYTDLPVTGDWNNDNITDVGLFRNGTWVLDSNGDRIWNSGTDAVFRFGLTTDTPVTGDWNGDGITDIGVFRNGTWALDSDGNHIWNGGSDALVKFGISTDKPVTGDWNNDGTTEIGTYRNGTWYLDMDGNNAWNAGTDRVLTYGTAGDTPLSLAP
ncbi:MAG: multicopper oxidase domain-containing protein [Proteobacteria bacterium]|nr:multicopper oxidase domain-containing protein [Pseudomonadota bacterium]MBU1738866.1 multicopper oxidase domain-containing protein [Pseudomonadota bacterium]